jgi:hypothetical protein
MSGERMHCAINLATGGLSTDVKIAGRWGIVAGHETNTVLNGPDTGDGLTKFDQLRNDGTPLGYTPVMTDATRATTFDDLGSELKRVRHRNEPVRPALR